MKHLQTYEKFEFFKKIKSDWDYSRIKKYDDDLEVHLKSSLEKLFFKSENDKIMSLVTNLFKMEVFDKFSSDISSASISTYECCVIKTKNKKREIKKFTRETADEIEFITKFVKKILNYIKSDNDYQEFIIREHPEKIDLIKDFLDKEKFKDLIDASDLGLF